MAVAETSTPLISTVSSFGFRVLTTGAETEDSGARGPELEVGVEEEEEEE